MYSLKVVYKPKYFQVCVDLFFQSACIIFSFFRTEYDWSDSPGVTPYKLVDPGGVRMKFGRTGSTDSDVPSAPSSNTIRIKLEFVAIVWGIVFILMIVKHFRWN